jgi:hypothetical protein
MEVNGQPCALATLTLGKELLVPTEWEVGVPHNWSGCFGKKKITHTCLKLKPGPRSV